MTTTQPATRAESFTFPELAEALETAPSDNASTHMLYLAPLQAWAVCAAMWREVARARGVATFAGEDDTALEQIAMRWQALAATALEGRPGLWGATGRGQHPFQASPQQAAVIADALREYTEDLHYWHRLADGEPGPVFKTVSVPATEEIGTLMRAANHVLDGIGQPGDGLALAHAYGEFSRPADGIPTPTRVRVSGGQHPAETSAPDAEIVRFKAEAPDDISPEAVSALQAEADAEMKGGPWEEVATPYLLEIMLETARPATEHQAQPSALERAQLDLLKAQAALAEAKLGQLAPKPAPTLPATRSPDFTLPDLADALEREPSDFDFATAHAIAPAQAWAICAAMWREVERRGAGTPVTPGGVTLYQLAHACQGLTAVSLWDYPTAESPAGRYGTSGQRLYMLMAGEGQMATIVGALRSYADDLRPRTIVSAGQHPAEPRDEGAPIWRRQTLIPWPEGTMTAEPGRVQPRPRPDLMDPIPPGEELRFSATPTRFQAPGRDLEDDGA